MKPFNYLKSLLQNVFSEDKSHNHIKSSRHNDKKTHKYKKSSYFEVDGIYYFTKGKNASVTSKERNSYSGNVIIPEKVTYNGTTYSVVSIGERAFADCRSLTSVTIPNSVTSIGKEAFWNCSCLTSVIIPNSVTSIGERAFCRCSVLTSVTIPNPVTSIGERAFASCSNLAAFNGKFVSDDHRCLIIDGELTAFAPAGVTEYSIPASVTSIGEGAFIECTDLTIVTIPNSVSSIGNYAFYGCSSLTSVTIPNSVTSIGLGAFSDCRNLTAFNGKFVSEDHRCLIVDGILKGFAPAGLTEYSIPNYVTSIDYRAFYHCDRLTSVSIPNSVTSIGRHAFLYAGIYNNESNWINGVLYISNCLIEAKGSALPRIYEIKSGTRLISDYAFDNCSELTSVTIPNSVTSIGNNPFHNTGIYNNDLNWINGVLYISNCLIEVKESALPHIYEIKSGIRLISDYAFAGCRGLNSVAISNSVTSIGEYAFKDCSGLKVITVLNPTPANIMLGDNVFYEVPKDTCILYVPNEAVNAYKTASTWKNFANIRPITKPTTTVGLKYTLNSDNSSYRVSGYSSDLPSNVIIASKYKGLPVTSIDDEAFWGCRSLNKITIPNSVTSIGSEAFRYCTGLTSVTIPNSVTSIGECAFSECHSLTSVTIPNSVTSIGSEAFRYCTGLTSVTIPNSVTSIGVWAFGYCSSLTSVIIPNSVTSIGERAFSGCSGLKSVTIPNSVTSIGSEAFSCCTGLTSVTIPNSVTSIGEEAFWGCSGLTSVIVENPNPANIMLGDYVLYVFPGDRCILYVPNEAVNAYKTASTWKNFANIQPITEPTTTGLEYTLNSDKSSYSVSGYTSDLPSNVIIPSEFEGLPVTSIGDSAFRECRGLTSVTIPNSVTSIDDGAFWGCRSLNEVTIPNSVTSIGRNAFGGRCSLTSVTIPNSVTSIGDGAFWGCGSLTSFNGKFASEDHRCLIVDGVLNSFAPAGLTEYSIPSSVKEIGGAAFYSCHDLTSVTIPNSVTSIGNGAFSCCSNLAAFNGKFVSEDHRCLIVDGILKGFAPAGLKKYSIPTSVTSIGYETFVSCQSLTSVTIPNSVKSIEMLAFWGCDSLTSITVLNPKPDNIYIANDAFQGVKTYACVLYVPKGSKELYRASSQWSEFANIEEKELH